MKNTFLFLLVLTLYSCKQESLPEYICTTAYTQEAIDIDTIVPVLDPISPYIALADRYKYYDPCFNPNYSNQIAYRRWERNIQESTIWIFDFCTGETTFLVKYRPFSALDWNVNNWITYAARDTTLSNIKPNGDSLTQLTSTIYNRNPVWDKSGERFLYRNPYRFILMADKYGNTLDTLEYLNRSTAWNWMGDEKVLATLKKGNPDYGVGYYNLTTGIYERIDYPTFDIPEYNVIEHLAWLENEQSIVWQTPLIVAKTNIHTKERTVLAEGFSSKRFYGRFDVSEDEQQIVIHRYEWDFLNIGAVYETNHLYMMNIDGSDKRKILLPE